MTEGTFTTVQLIDFLKTMPWCKQGSGVLVAVHKATAEIIDLLPDNELKVFPSGIVVKMQKSTLHNMQQQLDDGLPSPVVLVWKNSGLEIWYRKHNSMEFPYDAWTNEAAANLERERVFVAAEKFGPSFLAALTEQCAKTKECPTMIPSY
jgi:hypothetical protein